MVITETIRLPTYTSYVLRLRQQQTPQGEGHQVILHRVDNGEQYYFPDLEMLTQFLETGVASNSEKSGGINHQLDHCE